MAKRPSLLGTGRASLVAATGEAPPAPEAEAPTMPPRAPHRRRREKPAAEAAPAAAELAAEAPADAIRQEERDQPGFDGCAAFVRELMAFSGERLRRTAALAETFGRCRTPMEAIAAQSSFARETAAHYTSESWKLMRLASAAWAGWWSGLPGIARKAWPR